MFKVALIGCGYMGVAHLEDIFIKDNVKIVAVCDKNLEKAKRIANKFYIDSYYGEYCDMLENCDADIVIIATYPSTHLEMLKACIEKGIHVLCEKPITNNVEDGKKFVKLVKDNPKVKVLVGHILRHNDTYNLVAKLIRENTIGKPIVMNMSQNHRTQDWDKYLALIKETSPLIDCGVHYIDVMRWFTGAEIVDVKGVGTRTEPSVPKDKYNYGVITATLSDGSIGCYEAGWGHTIETNNKKEFTGPLGRIKITYQKDRSTHRENGNLVEIYRYPENTRELINVPYSQKPTGKQLDYLIEMIENDKPACPSIDEVFRSFEIVLKADKMIRKTNRKIYKAKEINENERVSNRLSSR